MNTIGIRCNVNQSRGSVIVVIMLENGDVHRYTYQSPSIFSFKENSGEILNWHRDNILSLITRFNIGAVSIKKSERDSFNNRPKNSDIFKLYLEGVLLSLAGSIGLKNHHYYKSDIKKHLGDNDIFNKDLQEIANSNGKTLYFDNVLAVERGVTKDALLAVITLSKQIKND